MIIAFFQNPGQYTIIFGMENGFVMIVAFFKISAGICKNKKRKGENKMKEKWKIIEEFPNVLISNKGNIKSLETLKDRTSHINSGYKLIALENEKGRYSRLVHRLVAQAFIPNPENKPCVNHLNGIKTDNRVKNSEWVAYKENIEHAVKTGLIDHSKRKNPSHKLHPRDEDNKLTKATKEQVIEMRKMYDSGNYVLRELSDKFGMSISVIWRIVNRKTWKHID